MRIRCWGSRGSISVSGKAFVRYGGDTTCVEIEAASGEIVIIDAGTGIRRLGKSLVQRGKHAFHLIFTHAHWDHIIGLPFFHPLLSPKTKITVQDRVFGNIDTKSVIHEVMKDPFFPVRMEDFQAQISFDASLNDSFDIGSLHVQSIPTSHSTGSLGYKFTEKGKTFVFLTDHELGFAHPQSLSRQAYIDFCKGADLLFHDAEYTADEYATKTGWGHSSALDVLELALAAQVGQLGLIHLNQDRTDDQMDRMVEDCNQFLKDRNATTTCVGVSYRFETTL